MRRERWSTYPDPHPDTVFTMTPTDTRHKPSPLLQLPLELRTRILRYLLYDPEPLGINYGEHGRISGLKKKSFKFHPAIMTASQQLYHEAFRILYRANVATATISVDGQGSVASAQCLDGLIYMDSRGKRVASRFTKWELNMRIHVKMLGHATMITTHFISTILRRSPNPTKLKVTLFLWEFPKPATPVTFDNPRDLDDVAEQIFHPFSALRVQQAEFVDHEGHPLRATSALSRLMMSDTPPNVTPHEALQDLELYLDGSLSEESRRVVDPRLDLLELARDRYDIDAFQIILLSLFKYLRVFRGLVLPQRLLRFVQDPNVLGTNLRSMPGFLEEVEKEEEDGKGKEGGTD